MQPDNLKLEEGQKLDKLEPEEIQKPCKLEPDEKEETKEKQKQRNVHSDKIESNGKQVLEKLKVVNHKQEIKQEPKKLKFGENQETTSLQLDIKLPLSNQEFIYPEELDSRNCKQDTESLECFTFQHQTKSEASDEDGASINTEIKGEHTAVDSKQNTNTCITDKNLKDNNYSLDKEEEHVFCKDRRKENIYSIDRLEEENVIIDKEEVEESNSIDKREEESFTKDKGEKDVFSIDKDQEENKKIFKGKNENTRMDTEEEILDSINNREDKLSINRVEEEDKSEKENAGLKRLKETEIPDVVGFPQQEIDLNCAPHYLEGVSSQCSSENEEKGVSLK